MDREYKIVIKNLKEKIENDMNTFYVSPENINRKKENFLENNDIIQQKLDSLNSEISKFPIIKRELDVIQNENSLLNNENKTKNIELEELKLKLKSDDKNEKIEIQETKSDLGTVVDKLNILISKLSDNNEPKMSSNMMEEHSKLIMNKRMYDMDEKLSDLVRKINQPYYQPVPHYQPPEVNIADFNSSNPFKKIPLYEEKEEEKKNEEEEEKNKKYEELLKKLSSLQEKYEKLNNTSPLNVTINNDKKIEEKREDGPFKYIYDDVDAFSFEKKPILKGGKLLEYKKMRKLRIT